MIIINSLLVLKCIQLLFLFIITMIFLRSYFTCILSNYVTWLWLCRILMFISLNWMLDSWWRGLLSLRRCALLWLGHLMEPTLLLALRTLWWCTMLRIITKWGHFIRIIFSLLIHQVFLVFKILSICVRYLLASIY